MMTIDEKQVLVEQINRECHAVIVGICIQVQTVCIMLMQEQGENTSNEQTSMELRQDREKVIKQMVDGTPSILENNCFVPKDKFFDIKISINFDNELTEAILTGKDNVDFNKLKVDISGWDNVLKDVTVNDLKHVLQLLKARKPADLEN